MQKSGFHINRSLFSEPELATLRAEADRLCATEGKACVRRALEKSPIFSAIASDPRITAHLGNATHPVRSLLFDKTPEENWPVAWHQDLTIAVEKRIDLPGYGPWSVKDGIHHVQPPAKLLQQMVTARIHFDDTPATNGALHVLPGSHLTGKREGPKHTCECAAGDILFMVPTLYHASSRSETPSHRRVLHIEFAPKAALHAELHWSIS